jgi:catechol 2,3-dioxygenase-like lactoylglutathione lyase family enzyme
MRIERLDHLVLTVADEDATISFYARLLGMRPITFDGDRRALGFGDSKINLHAAGEELDPRAVRPTPGSADLCLVTIDRIGDVVAELTERGVTIEHGPVPQTEALGPMTSVYFRDPDANLIEISSYIS